MPRSSPPSPPLPPRPPSRPSARLPRQERLRRRAEFLRVQANGRKLHGPHVLLILDGKAGAAASPPRAGFTASKRVGNAVARNRAKRLSREVFRRHKDWFPPGSEVVFIARSEAVSDRLTYAALEREVERLLRRGAGR